MHGLGSEWIPHGLFLILPIQREREFCLSRRLNTSGSAPPPGHRPDSWSLDAPSIPPPFSPGVPLPWRQGPGVVRGSVAEQLLGQLRGDRRVGHLPPARLAREVRRPGPRPASPDVCVIETTTSSTTQSPPTSHWLSLPHPKRLPEGPAPLRVPTFVRSQGGQVEGVRKDQRARGAGLEVFFSDLMCLLF